ncbi:MAG: hypothetical protein D6820_13265 [Lentisphaerae bacterium]|nr:MAG: hypothetical protein D6820_13265 [Lentisphaerota bacterium]
MTALKWTRHEDLRICIRREVPREEYLDIMTFKRSDRVLVTELFGPLIGLKEEWEAQGASPAELDFSAFRYRSWKQVCLPVATGFLGGFPEETLEETPEYRISRDRYGRLVKLPKGVATLAHPLEYPVRTMDDWFKLKPFYQFCPQRLASDWEERARRALADGAVVGVAIPGGFDEPRQLLGEENLCMAFYEQPELIHDILDTIADTALRVLHYVVSRVKVDKLMVHEDLAGKSGPLIGPRQMREFIVPYYRRIWDMLREHGARVFDVDSDGDINSIIPEFLDAGVNCLHPMEPAANMDIVQVRARYGNQLAFAGGIDKYALLGSFGDIRRELEYKVPPMLRTGGCALGLDHRIPNGTPLANYRFYLDTLWQIIDDWEN